MRYSMLAYLSQMCRTLLEAGQYLRQAPDSPERVEIHQSGSVMLGQIRSVLEGDRASLRSERLFALLDEAAECWESQNNSLENTLLRLVEALPLEVNYQVRAVIFAELGEKWDSLESIYTFMREDPRFDPVVVLTPVFRTVTRNGKQEQEVIYRDYLTPLGIPFLDYHRYSLEEDCPDLAFTCQPYESCTLPQFWPEKIARWTRLVYPSYHLPFLVTEYSIIDLCQMPVFCCAYRVIGSNEKHYRYYCRHSVCRGSNMVVTGLPKTDGLVHLREEGVPLPPEWEKLRGKKVFLLNNWYLLEKSASYRYFEKLCQWFDEHRDCALLWRPHPMTDSVAKLFDPGQYVQYQRNLERVKAAPNMVLDTLPSVAACFCHSHAQISDYSSLMQQYLFMDKPLLWMRNPKLDAAKEELISTKWMQRGTEWEDVEHFLEEVRRGEDHSAALRAEVLHRDLPLADGQCGRRVCEELWKSIHLDDGVEL